MATPSAPVISNAPQASPNTLEYWWYPPTSDGGASIEDYYLTLTSQYGVLSCNVGVPVTYYTVTGLSNATTYFTTIAASNANGLGATASFREFQPGSPPPVGVSTLSATALMLSTGAALVSWTPPITLPDATIFWYVINGYTTTDSLTPVLKYTAGGQIQSNYFIPGLDSNSNYYFTVNAVNCPGWSVPLSTNTITFITSVAFAPTQLNGLLMWLDATDSTTFSLSGTTVNSWTDKASLIQLSRTNTSITYEPNIFNTNSAVYFNGGYLSSGISTLNATNSINNITQFIIVRPATAAAGSYAQIAGLTFNTQNAKAVFNQTPSGVQAIVRRISGEALATSTTYPFATLSSFILNNYVNYSLGSNQLNVNGATNIFTTLTSTGATDTTNTMFLMGNNLFNERFNGYIGEYLLYNNYITPYQRQKTEGYLAWKWGLQSNLPTIHPFRSAAPQSNSVFSPTSFSSLQLWLDGTDPLGTGIPPTNGASVTTWVDKSGCNNSASAAGTTPTYTSLTSSILFGGAGYYNTNYSASLANESLFVVFQKITGSVDEATLVGQNADGGRYFAALTTNNRLEGSTYNVTAGTRGVTNSIALNNIYIAELITTANSQTSFVTGGSQGTTVTVTITAGRTSKIGVGFNAGVPRATQYLTGRIYEVLGYNTGLAAQDRQTVEGYLAWKWGLQGNLPTTHPYRYNNPAVVNFTQISPASFSNLSMWLDASQLTGLTNGGTLTTWVDKSSNGFSGTAVAGPTYITNSVNGLPVVRFNGTTQYVNFGNVLNISTNTGVAMFSIVKINSASAGIVGKTVAGPLSGRWTTFRQTNATRMLVQPDGDSTESTYSDSSSAVQLVEGLWDRQTQYIYQNGLLQDSDAKASTSNLSNSAPLYVGAYPNSVGSGPEPGFYLNGDVAEILVYMTNVTPFIRQQIEGYLTWKWGLQASLPSNHPYFTAPPQQAYTTFTPTLYSGLQLWLDASDTATLTGATSVSQWNDKSGNSNNVSQAVSAQQPVRYTAANGSNGLRFTASVGGTVDTGGQWFRGTFATPITNNQLSVFMIGSMNSATQQYGRAISLSQLTQNDYIASAGGANIARNSTANSLMMEANGASGPPTGAVSLATPFITESIFDGTNQTAFVNGIQTGTRAFTASFNIARSGIGFLSYQGVNTNTDRWDGTINEVLVFNKGLDTGSRQTVEGYLAWKWGLQGLLPVTHPYALINPANPTATPTVIESGLRIRFDATTYSGSGAWSNAGTLGTDWNATIEAGTPSKNTAGNGIVLNGSTNFTFPNISVGNAWSVSTWIKRTGSSGLGASYITQIYTGTGPNSVNLAVYTNDSATGAASDGALGGFFNSGWRTGTNITLTLNTWVNVTYTWNGTTLSSYNNGVLVGTSTPGVASLDAGNAYRIGRRWDSASYIVGEVGQVLIYNRAITGAEVIQNFSATRYTYSV